MGVAERLLPFFCINFSILPIIITEVICVNVKKKKRNSALESKNLIMLAIVAVAVGLIALTIRFLMPKTDRNGGFDNSAFETASSQLPQEATENFSKSGSGLVEVYTEDTQEVLAEAVPAEADNDSSDNENSSQGNAQISFSPPVMGAVTFDYSGDELVFSNTMQDWRTHNGIDFAAEEGTDVVAAADGTVEAITDSGMMGASVILLHSGGFRTIYSNLSDAHVVKEGDNVMKGSIIGRAGSTAPLEISEPPHIHFEMSLNEETINPHDYFSIDSANNE